MASAPARPSRRTPPPRRSSWLLLLPLLAACAGGPTLDRPRPLDAPVKSAGQLWDRFFSPAAMGRSIERLQARTGDLVADQFHRVTARRTLEKLADLETRHVAALPRSARDLGDAELMRLHDLVHSPAWNQFEPGAMVRPIAAWPDRLPVILHLDRRPLGEPDDVRHRTDPDDDHPEAGWLQRILRRLFP